MTIDPNSPTVLTFIILKGPQIDCIVLSNHIGIWPTFSLLFDEIIYNFFMTIAVKRFV